MRNIKFFVFGLIAALAALGIGVAIGQSSTSILGKALVQISQEIPVVADLQMPTADGKTITTTVPFTLGVNLQISLAGANVANIEVAADPTPVPTVQVRDAQNVPGMAGVDELGVPYILSAPQGLLLREWTATKMDDGGIKYRYKISTPGKKFDGVLHVNVSYRDDNDTEIAADGVLIYGVEDEQDRATRSYSDSFTCEWTECAGAPEKADHYIVAFEVDLVDFP